MTVKYIAFDGKEFDNEQDCKDYEKENGRKIRTEIGNARYALKRLDDFCDFWSFNLHYECEQCPLSKLCDKVCEYDFEDYFNKENPLGNVNYDGTIIEED